MPEYHDEAVDRPGTPGARSDERAMRVRALFCDLVDLPDPERAGRLAEVHHEDAGLAREIEELLRGADRSTGLLRELDDLFFRSTGHEADPGPDPFIGLELAHYRVLERLGGGGMGVVYRARHTQLDRLVALKFLPPRSSGDDDAHQQLVQEARAASALDHPNIATVYDIIDAPGGRSCIAMAYYDGRTVKEILADGPMELAAACDVGLQVARGLEAAHAHGIVHCDVKPANILVTAGGMAKILDFGIARSVDRDRVTQSARRGTPPYMAPEQLSVEQVTPATDVWAFGATFFEMVTGSPPFGVGDAGGVAQAILEREPPPLSSVVLVALAAWLYASGTDGAAAEGRFGHPRQLSSAEGVEYFASWSPAGDAILYEGEFGGEVFGGNPDIFVRSLNDELPRDLTADYTGYDGRPSWSPDGRQIAFFSDRQGGGYFVQPLAGGSARKVWEDRPPVGTWDAAAWSPDGAELAITVDGGDEGAVIEIVSSVDGELVRSIPLPGRAGNQHFGATWSPDGRFMAVADAVNITPDEARLWVVRLADAAAFPVTEGSDLAWSPYWGPRGRALYFISDRSGSRDLWVRDIGPDGRPRGAARELTTGVGMRNAAVSRSGTRLVYSKGRIVGHVWRIPILDGDVADWDDAERLTTDRAYIEFIEADPDGRSVYLSSDRGGNQDLWRIDVGDESRGDRLTTDPPSEWAPMLSPDGTRLAYYSARTGNREVWVRSLQDGTDVQITHDDGIDFVPSWSPDGSRVVFASGRSGNLDIWTVDLETGSLRQLTTDPAVDGWPHWSPDGSTIIFRSNRAGRSQLWTMPSDGGPPARLSQLPAPGQLFPVGAGRIRGVPDQPRPDLDPPARHERGTTGHGA